MDQREETVKSLNELLQGEYMAVNTLNVFISKASDDRTKKALQEVQNHHRQNIQVLANYIQDMGGYPDENLGFKGAMAELKTQMELGKADDHDVVRRIIEGETRGINMAEKVLRGTLDDRSRNLAGEILQRDRLYLDMLKTLQ